MNTPARMPKLTRNNTIIAVVAMIAISWAIAPQYRLYRARTVKITRHDNSLGVAVCRDGFFLLNRTSETFSNVVVTVNGLTNTAMLVPQIRPKATCQIQLSQVLEVTQIIAQVDSKELLTWSLKENGQDPRSRAQRQKTMDEAMRGQ